MHPLTAKPTNSLNTERTPADNAAPLTSTDGRQQTGMDGAAMTTDQKVGCSSHPERAEFFGQRGEDPSSLSVGTASTTSKPQWGPYQNARVKQPCAHARLWSGDD